jgi:dTDP-4-dehydrorhamnose reductase
MLEFVGSKQSFNTIIPIRRTEFDALLQPISSLKQYMEGECCIVNCIGAIPQKKYSENEMTQLNTTFPLELATYCNQMNIPLIHISTNCIFSGAKANCIESDISDAEDLYGQSKAKGEPNTCVVLRCSIIGPEVSSAAGLLEWFLHSQGSINGYSDHFWNGLTTLELAKTIYNIIDRRDFTSRIQHLHSQNTLSKYDILLEANRLFSKDITINPVSNGLKYYTLHSLSTSPSPTIQDQMTELVQIMPSYRNYFAKDIFLITSVINTGNVGWSYSPVRSIFSTKDRFEQTLKTIETIRALNDGTTIVISECSDIDESMERTLKEKVDIYLNHFHDPEIQNACIQSDKKGYGELLQTRKTLEYLTSSGIIFRRFFKISGRYWLTDKFVKSKFSMTEYSFNRILNDAVDHPTVIYSVPFSLIPHFNSVIEYCASVYQYGPIGLEMIMPPLCNPKTIIDGVGVAGFVAVDGTFYSTP